MWFLPVSLPSVLFDLISCFLSFPPSSVFLICRILRTQSLEWYYNNVKSRFKRFGSAKVLKTLYRKHIIERGALSDLPGNFILFFESVLHDLRCAATLLLFISLSFNHFDCRAAFSLCATLCRVLIEAISYFAGDII